MNYELSAEVVSFELDMLAQGRKNLVGLISRLSEKQVNLIPSGFKNNLIWNFGHNYSIPSNLMLPVLRIRHGSPSSVY